MDERDNIQGILDLTPEASDDAAEPAPEEEPESDWRINNAKCMAGATLLRRPFRASPGHTVEHCVGCWSKFAETEGSDVMNEGYCTYTEYDWVCGSCFEDLREPLHWKLAPARIAALLTTGGARIHHAHQEEWIPDVRELFMEYGQSLGIDLSFQDFDRELADLPGEYNRVLGKGCLLIGTIDDRPAGCVACRPCYRSGHTQEADICEMKRLYVRPDFRGSGLGAVLCRAVIDEARRLGYGRMRLDSLPGMERAQKLYLSLGFQVIAPYRPNPVPDTTYLELTL